MQVKNTKPIRQILLDMEVGDVCSFPSFQAQTVSSTASLLSFQTGRKFTTKRNRDTMMVDVTRIE